ncbi:MAG TPA: hypothetical protein VEQ12_05655 [Candidatus Limnocylindria bacterium]|nr:hypothetical protein [Candidatus Limnocylindria bacterium]
MSDEETLEQLRRLKNTVMGASNRLRLLAGEFPPDDARALQESAAALAETAQELDRLLARIRR